MSQQNVINEILRNPNLKFIFAAIKGFRNGLVYGIKIRAPHALVMTFIFHKGDLKQKLKIVAYLTYRHARSLSVFVFCYKLLTGVAELLSGQRRPIHSFLSAFVVGYFVFGDNNEVNTQINLYLLSRIMLGLAKWLLKRNVISQPKFNVLPVAQAILWSLTCFLHDSDKNVLQPSIRNSLTYFLRDSDNWTCIKDFIFVNRL